MKTDSIRAGRGTAPSVTAATGPLVSWVVGRLSAFPTPEFISSLIGCVTERRTVLMVLIVSYDAHL